MRFCGQIAPKNAKAALSEIKVMDRMFWDSFVIILIDYLENG